MTRTTVTRTINSPIETVFKAISDINNFPQVVPEIKNVEFISDNKTGVGVRFRETRLMNNKEAITELEVTDYVKNDRIRMVADSHGTIWDSIFTVKPVEGQTELNLTMDAKARKLLPKLLNPLLEGLYKKGVEKHMDAVKTFCENNQLDGSNNL